MKEEGGTVQSTDQKPIVNQDNKSALSMYLCLVVTEIQSLPFSLHKHEQTKVCLCNNDAWYKEAGSTGELRWVQKVLKAFASFNKLSTVARDTQAK